MRLVFFFFFSSRRRHTRFKCDWSSDVCSSDLKASLDEHSSWLLLQEGTIPRQLVELAFWFFTSSSLTTCFTLGTEATSFSTCSRLVCEGTSPVRVTTPFFTSYLTFFFRRCLTSVASKFFSMALSRSESTALASLSFPGGRTAISSATTRLGALDLAMASACCLSVSVGTLPLRVTTPLSRSSLTLTSLNPA